MERPYFLMGDARNPVYLWAWESQRGVFEARATGLAEIEPLAGGGLTGGASWKDGRWRLYLRRSIDAGEGPGLSFAEGVPIPIAFFASDGSSGERGKRVAIGSWYYLLLERPASRAVVVAPLLAILLTGGLGLAIVRRAQSRSRAESA